MGLWQTLAPGLGTAAAVGGLPDDRTAAIFARFAQILRGSLANCTVIDWTDPENLTVPGTDGRPWVRLTPVAGVPEVVCHDTDGLVSRIPLLVVVETATAGTNPAASLALWRAIQCAVYPLDAALEDLGVNRLTAREIPWGSPTEATAQARCIAKGVFELAVFYLTPN